MPSLEQYLLQAQGREKNSLAADNPFRTVGFDKEKNRLGWLRVNEFARIKEALTSALPTLSGKENFIFVGMGGSINGIKTLLSLFNGHNLFTLDSLDPKALEAVLNKIGDFDKTLIVAISKSGTTQETQLLSGTLKEIFKNHWQKHFLWLADASAFEKIDSLGWQSTQKLSIQVDGRTDIGGRFSSPHTMIFFLPLFLLLEKDFAKLERIYSLYVSGLDKIRPEAYLLAQNAKDKKCAYFFPQTKGNFGDKFLSWIVQLFQESLGSKREGFNVKTTCSLKHNTGLFTPLKTELTVKNPVASLMSQMYFFQVFIAFYAAFKNINFVDQDFVEKYKEAMRNLETGKEAEVNPRNLGEIIEEARRRITPEQKFIEVVLYFYPTKKIIDNVNKEFSAAFKSKMVFVFIGSDWNHHSYQAAFSDKNTFYVFLLLQDYDTESKYVSKISLQKNVEKLKVISKATYVTLQDKSILFSINTSFFQACNA